MDEAREHFLAGTRLARDENRAIARSDATSEIGEASRRIRDRDHVIGRRCRLRTDNCFGNGSDRACFLGDDGIEL